MADFQGRLNEFGERGIKIVAASVDNLEDAQKMIERHKLTFPVAYGINAKEFAAGTGAFFDDKKGFIHATGFIIRPEGIVRDVVYSTGPIGRLTAADTLRLVDYLKKTASQSKS